MAAPTATKRRAKLTEREQAIREKANGYAEAGKPFATPITPIQVKRVVKALGDRDPFKGGGPLVTATRAQAREVATNGGHDAELAQSAAGWKSVQVPKIRNDANLYNRRIIAIALAVSEIG